MNYKEITGNITLMGGVLIVFWLILGYHIKRIPYKLRYLANKILYVCGICPKCKNKMSRAGYSRRFICTVLSCK